MTRPVDAQHAEQSGGRAEAAVVEVRDLVVRYGPATALDQVNLHVDAGELVALIGPNGAGKSTLVNTLSGILKPAAGSVSVRGRLAHVPEGRQVFGDLTVEDNLRLGGRRYRERDTAAVHAILPRLADLRHRRAGTLSGGEQQMVAVGRALMSRPDVLAIDELSLGLAPLVVADLVKHIQDLNSQRGLAVLLIEQNARLALDLCTRAYVLEAGRIVAEGSSSELASDDRVSAAYLGGVVADPSGAKDPPASPSHFTAGLTEERARERGTSGGPATLGRRRPAYERSDQFNTE